MARAMLAAVFFIILMSFGATAINAGGDRLGHQYDIDGESVNAAGSSFDDGELVVLTNSNIENATYDDNSAINVYDENSIEMVEGQDYHWHEHNGTLHVVQGSGLNDSATLTIDYSFNIPTQQQTDVLTVVGGQLSIGEAMMYAFGAIIALAVLRLLAGAA